MAKTSFDEFVKSQQPSSGEDEEIDWKKQRDEWLDYLNKLYSLIGDHLKDYITSGEIARTYRDIELNEENIGQYFARELVLKVGRQEITFKPIGTLLIGMKGRVEVYGPAGSATLVLVNGRAEGIRSLIHVTVHVVGRPQPPPVPQPRPAETVWEWRILSRLPEGRFLPLTRESLFDLIMEIANG